MYKCGNKSREGQQTCTECHAAYMREWRKTHKMTAEQRRKDNCRSYSRVLEERGKIKRKPCEKCGNQEVQRHHEDYNDPWNVTWLCIDCHLELHAEERELIEA